MNYERMSDFHTLCGLVVFWPRRLDLCGCLGIILLTQNKKTKAG